MPSRSSVRPPALAALLVLLAAATLTAGAAAARATPAGAIAAVSDFNGDGTSDLAAGVPGENVDGESAAGAVNVIYGSPTGLSSTGNQQFTLNTTGVVGTAHAGDHFGWSLGTGDFDGDGFADLAVGVPDAQVGSVVDAGAVNVLYGSASGLTTTDNQQWTQGNSGIIGTANTRDRFGISVATGNYDGNGFDDLAIGVPNEDVIDAHNAGAVNVIYGGSGGLTSIGNQQWLQDSPGIVGASETDDGFGLSVAAGDFNANGFDDLAVGAPNEDLGTGNSIHDCGAANVIYGGSGGLSSTGNQLWSQDSLNIVGSAEGADHFAASVAAAEFGNGSQEDLAVGIPDEDLGTGNSITNAGAVNAIYGGSGGLSAAGNQLWTQESSGIAGDSRITDHFGFSVTGADFGNSSQQDLAIGGIGKDLPGSARTGVAWVIFGTSTGLSGTGSQVWSQDSTGIVGDSEPDDKLGWSLIGADFGMGPQSDLAIGVPFEDLSGTPDGGGVNVIYGTASGLTSSGSQFWTQESVGIIGESEPLDRFGQALG
jgi:FG-GAP repeat protein